MLAKLTIILIEIKSCWSTEAKMKRECCALEMHATYEADTNQVYSKDHQYFCGARIFRLNKTSIDVIRPQQLATEELALCYI